MQDAASAGPMSPNGNSLSLSSEPVSLSLSSEPVSAPTSTQLHEKSCEWHGEHKCQKVARKCSGSAVEVSWKCPANGAGRVNA